MTRIAAVSAAIRGPRRVPFFVLALVLVLSACETALLHVTGALPFFPTDQRDGPRAMMAARSSGTLTLEDNCLWLRSGQNRHLIIWPASSRVEWREGQLVVVSGTDAPTARVGDDVDMGGGEWREEDFPIGIDRRIEAIIGQPVPPACRDGLYWLGAVIDDGG